MSHARAHTGCAVVDMLWQVSPLSSHLGLAWRKEVHDYDDDDVLGGMTL